MIAEQEILALPDRFHLVGVDRYVVMPDHLHLIVTLYGAMPGTDDKPPVLSNVIGCLKAKISHRIGGSVEIWQSSFDHIIRNEREYGESWDYIDANPLKYIGE